MRSLVSLPHYRELAHDFREAGDAVLELFDVAAGGWFVEFGAAEHAADGKVKSSKAFDCFNGDGLRCLLGGCSRKMSE